MTLATGHADRPVTAEVRDGVPVILKRYVTADAAEVHDVMRALWASPFGGGARVRAGGAPAMPEPLALEHGDTIVMRAVPGVAVGARGDLGRSFPAAVECARLLARLHDSGVQVRRRRHAAALLRSLERKADRLRTDPWSLAAPWRTTFDALARLAPEDEVLVVSHGDFSPRNVLVEGGGPVALIDFDRVQMASRSRDVEYWRAWCWATQLLAGDAPDWRCTAPFVDAYVAVGAPGAAAELAAGERFHRAAALLRIAEGWSALRADPHVARRVLHEAERTVIEGAGAAPGVTAR